MAQRELVIDPGATIRFEYETMGNTFEVEAIVTEVAAGKIWFDPQTEDGPGIDTARADWDGLLTARDDGSWMAWAVTGPRTRGNYGKGTAQDLRVV